MNESTRSVTDLVDLYLLRCEVEGTSSRTVRAYLGGHTKLSLETRHRYFREVRCFFNWLVEAGYLDQNPFRGMRNVRLPQRIVRPFSTEDIAALLAACGDGSMGVHDRALVLALLDTGARCSEIVRSSSPTSISRWAGSASSTPREISSASSRSRNAAATGCAPTSRSAEVSPVRSSSPRPRHRLRCFDRRQAGWGRGRQR